MSVLFQDLQTAEIYIQKSLVERGISIDKVEKVVVDKNKYGQPVYHSRIWTGKALYQIKFQKKEHLPLADNQIKTAFKENERLKYCIRSLGHENPTDIGLNLNVVFDLLELEEQKGVESYFLNVVGESIVFTNSSIIYWCKTTLFYELAMSWGTSIYNSSSYGGTVFLVPSGWMKLWSEPKVAFPIVIQN